MVGTQEAANTQLVQDAYAAFGRGDITMLLGYMSEDTRALYVTFIRQFRAKNQKEWQQLFVDELRGKLQVLRS